MTTTSENNATQIKFRVRSNRHAFYMVQQIAAGNYAVTDKRAEGKYTVTRFVDDATGIFYEKYTEPELRAVVLYGKNGNSIKFIPTNPKFPEELTAEQIVEFRNFLGLNGVAPAEELSLTARVSLLEKQNKILEARLEKLEHVASLNKALEERVAKLEIEVWGVKK